MALFDESTHGKPICKTIIKIIKYNKANIDIDSIAKKHGYTSKTLSQYLRGYRNVNKNNADMLRDAVSQCFKKGVELINEMNKL